MNNDILATQFAGKPIPIPLVPLPREDAISKRPEPPPRVYKSPWNNPSVVATINQAVITALHPEQGSQIQTEIPTILRLRSIEQPEVPQTRRSPIQIGFLSTELDLNQEIEEIRRMLIKAKEYGELDPSIYGFGSVARTTCARLHELGYKIGLSDRIFHPEHSDLDIIVPTVLRNDPNFKRFESATCVPTSSFTAPPENDLIVIKENLVSETPMRLDISILRIAPESSIHTLNLINGLLPEQPLVRFWLDSNNQLNAEGIVITETCSLRYDPQAIGIMAYSNAINLIASEIGNSDPTELIPQEQIYVQARAIHHHPPEHILERRIKEWSEAIIMTDINIEDSTTPLGIETRYLALASANVVNNIRRNLNIFERQPQKAIYYLGQSGLLSLAFQCSLFIIPSSNDVIERLCKIFIDATEQAETQNNTKNTYGTIPNGLHSLMSDIRYKAVRNAQESVSRLPYLNFNKASFYKLARKFLKLVQKSLQDTIIPNMDRS